MACPISVVIPAYNEEGRISGVLEKVVETGFEQVTVVDDGSDDSTFDEADSFSGVEVLRNERNMGKAEAIRRGVEASEEEHLMFLDADLTGLDEKHLEKMAERYLEKKELMIIGVFSHGRTLTDLAMTFSPMLSGQRILPRKVWKKAEEKDMKGFGVEVAVNRACKELGVDIKKVELPGVSHTMKEEKRGPLKGSVAKSQMYLQILLSYLKDL